LGGRISSDPSVAVNSDGRIEVFARGTDDALWHIWQDAPHAGPWSAWSSLGGVITSDPAAALNSDGRVEVFARGTDGALWHIWQTVAHAGPWSAWASLGGVITSSPAVELNSDGRLEVFARGTDHALWHIWQTVAHTASWSAWASFGGSITSDPGVALNSDGRLEVFARGTDGALWHVWQTVAHGGPWSTWSSLGGVITSDPAVALNSDGRLEVFARGTDNSLCHIWQTAPHAGPWSAWGGLGGVLITPGVYLGLNEQHQQQTEWCWSATTVSITLFYDPAATWTQCTLVNNKFGQTTCCTNGSSNACNQPGYPDQALTTTGHLASTALGKPSLQTLTNQLEAGHPVSINIQWNGGGGHNPATDGYDNRDTATPTIDIQDPWYGQSTQDFNTFPGSYNGGASWYESYFTK
jgi:acylphosphatase